MRVPRLHVVTDDSVLARPGFDALARSVLEAGGGRLALHLRGPRTSGRAVFELAKLLLPAATDSGAFLFVNDRVDVALAADVRGIHLGARSLRVEEARVLVGPTVWIGASVHDSAAAGACVAAGADFLFAGAVFATPSHCGRAGGGLTLVNDVRAASGAVPVIAIGGVLPSSLPELLDAGACGVAAVTGVWDADHPAEAVQRYLFALDDHTERRGDR